MSDKAREKAKKYGIKSGKGTQLLSRLLGRLDDEPEEPPEYQQ